MPWRTVAEAQCAADEIVDQVNAYLVQNPFDWLSWEVDPRLFADVEPDLDPSTSRRAGGRMDLEWRRRESAFYNRLRRRLAPEVYLRVFSVIFERFTLAPAVNRSRLPGAVSSLGARPIRRKS